MPAVQRSYQYAQSWFGHDGHGGPLIVVILCIPLALMEENAYGCRVLPHWERYFAAGGRRAA